MSKTPESDYCEVIAEAGVNHNGNLETAKKLVDVACDAGAGGVKFQTFKTEEIVTEDTEGTEYQKKAGESNQYEMLNKLELSKKEHKELIDYCEEVGIEFLSTPYDPESVRFLDEVGVGRYKIASADIVNKPLLEAVSNTQKPVILSTGMATLGEIERAVNFLHKRGCPSLTVLHCVSCYPTDPEDLNLRFMNTLDSAFDVQVGFSDHTLGTSVPILAAGIGAELVEKHFTLDRSMEGPDHTASLEPDELAKMVEGIRDATDALGDGTQRLPDCEKKNLSSMRRSIHTRHNIESGDMITESDIVVVRPTDGISPWKIDEVVGKSATTEIEAHEPINWDDIE
jgi:N-acetylneuraminate synthase